MSKGKDYFSKSLEKGLKVLSLFDGSTRVLTQSEVAKRLGLNMTSTYRYINTLVELGYLTKDSKTKEIRPAVQCLMLCNNLLRATDRLKMIREVVDAVHRRDNISIEVALVVDNGLVRIYNREAEETFTYRLPDATTDSLHNTALGKAYLSTLSDEELEDRLGALTLQARTDRTITDREALRVEIRKTKKRRYATTDEEYLPGLLAIAAPLYDPVTGGGVGAVSFDFSVMQHSAREIEEKYAAAIVRTAAELSELTAPELVAGPRRGTAGH